MNPGTTRSFPAAARTLRALAAALALAAAGCGSGIHSHFASSLPPPTTPPPTPTQTGTVVVSPQYAALFPAQTKQFTATITSGGPGTIQWEVNGTVGGDSTVGTIDSKGNYTAPASLTNSSNVVVTAALAASPTTNNATAVMSLIAIGVVSQTNNPQVANYALYLPAPGGAAVDFGKDISYPYPTSQQAAPSANGGQVNVLVAGMIGSTLYHMRAQVALTDGATATDIDHTFTTGAAPATTALNVDIPSGQRPQPGIELFDTVVPHTPSQVFATDVQGNVIWTYTYTDGNSYDLVYPVRLLPNGHVLVLISSASSAPAHGGGSTPPPGTIEVVREVDLAGATVRELSVATINAALAASTNPQVKPLNLIAFHHDVLPLANGHFIVIASLTKSFTNLPGYPGNLNVLGDALIDVDQNFNPVWTWNSFDHLDVNRHPFKSMFPDWTHSNAILYSTDDHNLLLSIRHQNWIIKIDYQDGQGNGNILWHLGEGGEFKLVGGVDPTDWFYAQHGPNYFTPNTTGVFQLGVLDNGNDRIFPAGVACGTGSAPPCQYSTAMVLRLDESAMTATFVHHYVPQPYDFDAFGGNVDLLANGDIEADFCGIKTGSVIDELSYSGGGAAAPQLVWQATTPGSNQYRALRLPSLYPGIQWP